jgi:hypothetical protein
MSAFGGKADMLECPLWVRQLDEVIAGLEQMVTLQVSPESEPEPEPEVVYVDEKRAKYPFLYRPIRPWFT